MPVSDSEYRAALTRAGDASAAEAVACRERAEARCDLRRTAAALLEARAVIRAACAALGASATGDLAADVARVVRERNDADARADKRERSRDAHADACAAAEATLRETQAALARMTADLDAARDTLDGYERDDRAVRRAVAALPFSSADGNSRHLRLTLWEPTARRGTLSVAVGDSHEGTNSETAIGAIAGAVRSIAARIEAAPPVEAAPKVGTRVRAAVGDFPRRIGTIAEVDADDPGLPYLVDFGGSRVWLRANEIEPAPVEPAAVEAPHRVGDVWRRGHAERVVEDVGSGATSGWLDMEDGVSATAEGLRANGWRRVRCAPAVGDVVQTAGGDGAKAGELVALTGEE